MVSTPEVCTEERAEPSGGDKEQYQNDHANAGPVVILSLKSLYGPDDAKDDQGQHEKARRPDPALAAQQIA
jgi:hypothetical protein